MELYNEEDQVVSLHANLEEFAPHITPNSMSMRLPPNYDEVCNRILHLVIHKVSHGAQHILKPPITLAKLTKIRWRML